jgi:hypothetical protein
MGQPWLERWDIVEVPGPVESKRDRWLAIACDGGGGYMSISADDEGHPEGEARARLAAKAPELVRALLEAESTGEVCPACHCEDEDDGGGQLHQPTCPVDAALTSVGFPDASSRALARNRLRAG